MRRHWQTVAAIILLIPVLIFAKSYLQYRDIRIQNLHAREFREALALVIKNNDAFDMREVTAFEWDEFYIIHPYTPRNQMQNIVGARWTTAESYLGFLVEKTVFGEHPLDDDIIQELVFLKDGKVVCDTTFMRYDGDFVMVRCGAVTPEDALFTVDKSDENHPVLVKVE